MARKIILITGSPGTGKTTLAASLSKKMGCALLDINKIVKVARLYSGVDEEDGAQVVLLPELEKELRAAIKAEKRSIIVEGHLGCEMKLPVQKVLVLRCEPKELRARLAPRGYSPKKLASNALSEALDYCTALSEKNFGAKKVWEMDTTSRRQDDVLAEAESIISGRKKKKARIGWPDALMREAITGEKIRAALHG